MKEEGKKVKHESKAAPFLCIFEANESEGITMESGALSFCLTEGV